MLLRAGGVRPDLWHCASSYASCVASMGQVSAELAETGAKGETALQQQQQHMSIESDHPGVMIL